MTNDKLNVVEDIKALRDALARNELIRRKLPGGGRIHIDRQQPFICVYRYPSERPDPGTDRLLLGGASYLLIPGSQQLYSWSKRLIGELAAQLVENFGAAIVLELWSAADPEESSGWHSLGRPRFRIVSPARLSPKQTLETLERAIVTAHWPGAEPTLEVEYLEEVGPPGMPPLLGIEEPHITLLGLELAPIYRDLTADRLYPEVLRDMRTQLWHVLRQAFFAFSHTRATHRPAHYHELGPRAMTNLVAEADRALAAVSDSFDLLLHVTPVNNERAWADFETGKYQHAPEFHYRPLHIDPSQLKRKLYEIRVDEIDDPALHELFATKRDEIDRQITMLGDRESPRFLPESLQIYGRAAPELTQMADSLLERAAAISEMPSGELLSAEEFAAEARKELAFYSEQDSGLISEVVVSDTIPGIMVSKGTLFIGRHATVEASRVAATLHHEIGTHVLTYYNGLTQPFQQLHAGLAGYEELQEGLAVFAEYLVGGLSSTRLRVLAARVMAVESVAEGADFVETFRVLTKTYGLAPRPAYTVTMRVHRAGGFSKDVVYLRGLAQLLEYLADRGDHAELLVGKISLSQIELIRELRWRRIIEAPRLRPRYLEQPFCLERLQRARDGLSIPDLLET